MTRSRVDADEALRRVHGGGVAKSAGRYFDHCCPVPGYLTGVFDQLIWAGLVSVADGDPVWAIRGLGLTEAGQARYAQSCQRQRAAALQAPPPEHTKSSETLSGPLHSMSTDPGRLPVEREALPDRRFRAEAPGGRSALGRVLGPDGVRSSGPEGR